MEHDDYTEQRDGLLESIERDREDVRVAMHELSEAAHVKLDLLDISTHIRSSPLAWTVAAFLLGAWLGERAASAGNGQRYSR
jgi:hypothetical protein